LEDAKKGKGQKKGAK